MMNEQPPQTMSPEKVESPQRKMVEVASIPRALVWSMGVLAVLMLMAGCGVLLWYGWDSVHVGVKVAAMVVPVLLLWGMWCYGVRQGFRSGELAGALASITWLEALLVWQCLVPSTPEWVPGVLFILGALSVAVFFPNRTSVAMLAVASVAELALLWFKTTTGDAESPGLLLWGGGVGVLCLWGLGGFMCGLTRHTVYAPYAFLGPLMFSLYLLALQGVILYLPGQGGMAWMHADWGWMAGLWLLPVAGFCVVHRLVARRSGKGALSGCFVAMLAAMYVVVPVGMWASQVWPMVPGVVLLFVYAVCMVRYGAVYRSTYFMVAGSGLAFLSALGVAFGQGGSLVSGGIVMLCLGATFAWFACRLHNRRRRLQMAVALAQARQEQGK